MSFTSVWDKILDYSIYYSFDHTGFLRHSKEFNSQDTKNDLTGDRVLVTGGSSGIGLSCVRELYEKGAEVWAVARDKPKANKAFSAFYRREDPRLQLLVADLAYWDELIEVCENRDFQPFTCLIFNAGGMPPDCRLNSHGYELTFASQVLGHFIFFSWLHDKGLLAKDCRVIWVSSGGMYLQKLQLEDLNYENSPYDKVQAYANAKRAQVILNQEMAERFATRYAFCAMHPGWVRSPGLESALPGFTKFTQKRLRSAREGADTALWLSQLKSPPETGQFWFNRKPRPVYPFPWTKESPEQRQKLMQICDAAYTQMKQRFLQ